MKKLVKLIALPFLLLACNSPEKPDGIPEENPGDSLAVATTRVSVPNVWLENMDRILKTLDSINTVRHAIYVKASNDAEFSHNTVSEINNQILLLNGLLKRNEEEVVRLNKRLRRSKDLNNTLKDSINSLNSQLVEKQLDIMDLYEVISELNDKVFQLEGTLYCLYAQNAVQNASIVRSITESNAMYYVIGNEKELKQKGVLDKTSGLLGLRPESLNSEMDPSFFTKGDQREKREFTINRPHAKLLTIHSTTSYRFERDKKQVKRIIITDPSEFWRVSRFLVIKTD